MKYKTTDIVLATCLKMQGYKIEKITVEGRRGTFIFVDIDQSALDEFNYDGVRVEPKEFHNCVRNLTGTINRMITNGEFSN